METAPWYYVSADRQRQGPVPADTIRSLYAAGTLNPRSLVWRQGMPQWLALEQVAAELGLTLATATPAPTPPPAPPPPSIGRVEPSIARVEPSSVYPDAAVQQAYAAQVGVDPQARAFRGDGHVLYASFLKRVAASLIDGFIVGLATVAVQMPIAIVGGVGLGAFGGDPTAGTLLVQFFSQLIGIAIGVAYFGYFYTSAQQASPGKLLVGIKVARPDGERISFARSVGRYFANWLNFFTLGLSYLLPLFTEKRQALHDLVCDTVVVDRWAFTDTPERQDEALGGCAIAVLVIWGLLIVGSIVAVLVMMAAFGSAGWR